NFRVSREGKMIGLELGADIGAHMNLDDFLVYEGNETQSRDFFSGLFYKHLRSLQDAGEVDGLAVASPQDLLRIGFADARAFDELVRAAEGVPRDAIYIASRAGMRSGKDAITVPVVREAARSWYQTDKFKSLESRQEAQELLGWIIERVI